MNTSRTACSSAARTRTAPKNLQPAQVNKERAQKGESKTADPKTLRDMPAPVRGGKHSHTGPQGRTREQLYEDARRQGIKGRSTMNKAALARAVARGRGASDF